MEFKRLLNGQWVDTYVSIPTTSGKEGDVLVGGTYGVINKYRLHYTILVKFYVQKEVDGKTEGEYVTLPQDDIYEFTAPDFTTAIKTVEQKKNEFFQKRRFLFPKNNGDSWHLKGPAKIVFRKLEEEKLQVVVNTSEISIPQALNNAGSIKKTSKTARLRKYILYYPKGTGEFITVEEPKEEYSQDMVSYRKEMTKLTGECEIWAPDDCELAVKVASLIAQRKGYGSISKFNFKEVGAEPERRKRLEVALSRQKTR